MATQTWTWRFEAPPEKVWPGLADTARFNEASGTPKYRVDADLQPDGTVIYTGRAKLGPFDLSWRDRPQEWITNQYFRHERDFHNGPFLDMIATMRLTPEGGATRGDFTLEMKPRNLLGRLLLAGGFYRGAGKTFARLFGDAAAFAAGRSDTAFVTPKPALSQDTRTRLAAIKAALEKRGVDAALVARLITHVTEGAEVDLLHIRPLRLAARWGVEERPVIELCLHAVQVGLLVLRWDLLCPNCRGGPASVASLDQLPRGAHCGSCNIDYERDFARNVELNFRPNPAIRTLSEGEFCLFSPMSTPHVAAQQTLQPGETRELDARLEHGDYRFRPLNGAAQAIIEWRSGGFPELVMDGDDAITGPAAPAGKLRFVNRGAHEITVVLESRDWVRDALTAHRVASLQTFRDLFGTEVLRPGDDAGVGLIALMFTDLKGSTALYGRIGDAAAYRLVRDHFAFLAGAIREREGAIVKTIGDAVMASFTDPAMAFDAALDVQRNVMEFNRKYAGGAEDIVIKIGLHAGACIAVNLNDRLDYFGTTVNMAARLQGESEGGDIVVSAAMAADPGVAARLREITTVAESAQLKGFDAPTPFLRVPPGSLTAAPVKGAAD